MSNSTFLSSSLPWICIFRVLNAVCVQSWLHPDEYWQSLEVSHDMVFGYGHRTWEWQPEHQIRGYLHPLLFAAVYQFLKITGLDSRNLIAIAPRLLQASFAILADVYIYKFARRLFGPTVAQYAFFASLTNWSMFYVMVRTFSNTLEAALTAVVLYHWPWTIDCSSKKDDSSPCDPSLQHHKQIVSTRRIAIVMMAVTFLVRPTSAIMWVFLGFHHLWLLFRTTYDPFRATINFVAEVIVIVTFFCGIGVLIDRACYGSWTFVPYNFFLFNALEGGSNLYGVSGWPFYFLSISYMLLSVFPAFLYGLKLSFGAPALLLLSMMAVYTFTPHKESRFLLPVFPLALAYSGLGLNSFCASSSRKTWILSFIVVSNMLLAGYSSFFSATAPVALMGWLSNQPNVDSVAMLTLCHSTPHYSMFHTPPPLAPLYFLDCSPSPAPETSRVTLDFTESSDFGRDPLRFATQFFDVSPEPKVESHCNNRCSAYKLSSACVADKCCAWYSSSCAPFSIKPLPSQWKYGNRVRTVPYTNLTYWRANWRRSERLKLPSHLVFWDLYTPALYPFLAHIGYNRTVTFDGGFAPFRTMEVWQSVSP